jgi:WD40 repeat protein
LYFVHFFFPLYRLFSCGTSKDGESHLVEWNESEGAVKRTYQGFRKRSMGVVQFDTTRNRFLAAGDEFVIKIWDMDNTSLLTTIEADGGLPVSFSPSRALLFVNYFFDQIKTCSNLKTGNIIIRQAHVSALTRRVLCWLFLLLIMV